MRKRAKFGVGIGVILVSLVFLAWLGYGESKTYYHTIAELPSLHGAERVVCVLAAPWNRARFAGFPDAWISRWKAKGKPCRLATREAIPCRIRLWTNRKH